MKLADHLELIQQLIMVHGADTELLKNDLEAGVCELEPVEEARRIDGMIWDDLPLNLQEGWGSKSRMVESLMLGIHRAEMLVTAWPAAEVVLVI